nr:PREDICTED: uncharacterized protein LOC109630345 [Paralichthys olivaceus]XP_019944071.1 PREDICTED: uncharacterized protein LOC109630345 [Paralichthys olivaceus]
MSETQTLLGAPRQQTAVDVGAPAQGGRSANAYKVVGLTVLACVLVMSQAMIIYFLVNQRGDIKSLEEQHSGLNEQLTKGRSASMSMQLPSSFHSLTFDEKSSTRAPEETGPPQATQCQLEAAGEKPVQVPGLRPDCDERGLYRLKQCLKHRCWCVNPANGEQIPGSLGKEDVTCNKGVHSVGLDKVL